MSCWQCSRNSNPPSPNFAVERRLEGSTVISPQLDRLLPSSIRSKFAYKTSGSRCPPNIKFSSQQKMSPWLETVWKVLASGELPCSYLGDLESSGTNVCCIQQQFIYVSFGFIVVVSEKEDLMNFMTDSKSRRSKRWTRRHGRSFSDLLSWKCSLNRTTGCDIQRTDATNRSDKNF